VDASLLYCIALSILFGTISLSDLCTVGNSLYTPLLSYLFVLCFLVADVSVWYDCYFDISVLAHIGNLLRLMSKICFMYSIFVLLVGLLFSVIFVTMLFCLIVVVWINLFCIYFCCIMCYIVLISVFLLVFSMV
jgi:hypothetical protein